MIAVRDRLGLWPSKVADFWMFKIAHLDGWQLLARNSAGAVDLTGVGWSAYVAVGFPRVCVP